VALFFIILLNINGGFVRKSKSGRKRWKEGGSEREKEDIEKASH